MGTGGGICMCGQVGDQSVLVGYMRLSPCSVVLPAKSEKRLLRARMQGKFNSEEVKYKWLKGGSLA